MKISKKQTISSIQDVAAAMQDAKKWSAHRIRNKKILIMGLGLHGGGAGAAKFFARAGAKVTVTDLRAKKQLHESVRQLRGFPIRYVLGGHREKDFIGSDLIIRNPAVPDDSPYLKIAKKHNVSIDTDIGIFFELCPAKIIGVTGTRGKSTTASLIYEILKTAREKAVLAGNIRRSVLSELPRITKKSVVVLELSSWQLEGLQKHKKSPHIAVITTILPDHLNRYKSMADYILAKKIIFEYQTPNDYLFLNKNDKIVNGFAREAVSKIIFFENGEARKYRTNLPGNHNLINIAAAVKVAKHLGIPETIIQKALRRFHGLEGRLESVSRIRDVAYINDTCATTPDATIAAINALTKNWRGNLILIAGGTDKKLDFKELSQVIIKKVNTIILLPGTATAKIQKAISNKLRLKNHGPQIEQADNMSDAVRLAAGRAEKGDIVLLSPASASFGLFRHEFERGEKFKKALSSIRNQ